MFCFLPILVKRHSFNIYYNRRIMLKNLVFLLFLVAYICVSSIQANNQYMVKINVEHTIKYINAEEQRSSYWRKQGKATILNRLKNLPNTNTAKNLILFIGDGMSITTVTAARIYLGQLNGETGESSKLSFETFPYVGLSKTYCVNYQVADSASTATAYLGGVKANLGTLGVNAAVQRGNCTLANDPANRVYSIMKWAQDAGKATGLVTTARVTHASPGGNYAATPDRNFESDFYVSTSKSPDKSKCTDIAKQLVFGETGKNMKVILGGGRKMFLPNTVRDVEYANQTGTRLDKKNLINQWRRQKRQIKAVPRYVWNRKQLQNTKIAKTDYLMGLFNPSHMKFHLEANPTTEPTLEEMTRVAIKMLQKESKGFYLFVEGGRIDHGHHNNMARRALDETVEMHKAVQAAMEMTDAEDTLIVVTADHAHTMSIGGQPGRGNDILADYLHEGNLTYITLTYANGPSAVEYNVSVKPNPQSINKTSDTYMFPSLVKLSHETHAGQDVAIFARGPWSHLFSTTLEQNVIPLAMGFAAGIGPAADLEGRGDDYQYEEEDIYKLKQ